jgi:hypothetical protein
VALPFTLKSILRQKKNYGDSNISSCENISFKKPSKKNQNASRNLLKETKMLQDIITVTYLKFQHKPKYHLSKILI